MPMNDQKHWISPLVPCLEFMTNVSQQGVFAQSPIQRGVVLQAKPRQRVCLGCQNWCETRAQVCQAGTESAKLGRSISFSCSLARLGWLARQSICGKRKSR